jgi:hypothetical protein
MCFWKATRDLLTAAAVVGLLMPPSFVAAQVPAESVQSAPVMNLTTSDVALDDNGFLKGVVVDDAGMPQSDVLVYIVKEGAVAGSSATTTAGEFQLKLNQGGMYTLLVGNRTLSLRCWSLAAAPPHAAGQLMVPLDDVYRGQIHPAACGLGSPWVIAGLVTAAVVIPVALHNNRSDRAASSQ